MLVMTMAEFFAVCAGEESLRGIGCAQQAHGCSKLPLSMLKWIRFSLSILISMVGWAARRFAEPLLFAGNERDEKGSGVVERSGGLKLRLSQRRRITAA